jgi:hypothetical protein
MKKKQAVKDEPVAYRLEDLTVEEVSLVDRPAIGREFLLMKRQEEDTVGKKEEEHGPEAPETETPELETPVEEHPEEPEGTEPVAVAKAEDPGPTAAEQPTVAHDDRTEPDASLPTAWTLADGIRFLAEHKSELSRAGQAALGVLERQKQGGEATVDFDTAYRQMAAQGDVWACFDAMFEVVWSVLDSEEENQLAAIDEAVKAFGVKLAEILGGVGVKSAPVEPQKVKIGDAEVEVAADEFQAAVLTGMSSLADQMVTLSERVEQPAQKRDGKEEAVQVQETPLTPAQVAKMIQKAIAEARRPIYKSAAVVEEDTQEEKPVVPDRQQAGPGATVMPGLAGLKEKVSNG